MDVKPIKYNIGAYKIYILNMPSKNVYVGGFIENGAINESKKNCGINHLLEHVLINAWDTCNSQSCFTYWDKRPVYLNASANTTYVDYFINGLQKEMKDMVEYIFDIITNPVISEKNVNTEKKIVKNELYKIINHPTTPMVHKMNEVLYNKPGIINSTNYELQVNNLQTISTKDIVNYYNKIYTAEKTSFYVSGNFTNHQTREIIDMFRNIITDDDYVKNVKNVKNVNNLPIYYNDVFTYNGKIVHHKNTSAKNTDFCLAIPLTKNYIKYSNYRTSLKLLKTIMNIHLFNLLRTQLQLIYGIHVSFNVCYYGVEIVIQGSCIDENIKPVLSELMKWLTNVPTMKVTLDELEQSIGKRLLKINDNKITPYSLCKYYEKQIHLHGAKKNVRLLNREDELDAIKKTTLLDLKNMQKCILVKHAVIGYTSKRSSRISLASILPK